MKTNVYAVFDSAAKAYIHPFNLPRDEMAIRAFSDAVNGQGHQFAKWPADYTLHRVGTFDDALGTYSNEVPSPVLLTSALAVIIRPHLEPSQVELPINALNGATPHVGA